MPTAIDPIPGTYMNAQLDDAFANSIAVAEVTRFDLAQADADACRGSLVTYAGQPVSERFATVIALGSEQINHKENCNLKATGRPTQNFPHHSHTDG